jgi:hypothetical protein
MSSDALTVFSATLYALRNCRVLYWITANLENILMVFLAMLLRFWVTVLPR